MDKSLYISRHFNQRAKERLSLKKRALKRYALTAYKNGVIIKNIQIKDTRMKDAREIVVRYKESILILIEYQDYVSFATVLNIANTKQFKKRGQQCLRLKKMIFREQI